MERGTICSGLFMDLPKAYGTIDNHIMLNMFEYHRGQVNALQWVCSYLHQLKQYIITDSPCRPNLIQLNDTL